jgi:hypothetical protein
MRQNIKKQAPGHPSFSRPSSNAISLFQSPHSATTRDPGLIVPALVLSAVHIGNLPLYSKLIGAGVSSYSGLGAAFFKNKKELGSGRFSYASARVRLSDLTPSWRSAVTPAATPAAGLSRQL